MSLWQKTKAFIGFEEEGLEHFPEVHPEKKQVQRKLAPRASGKLLSFPQVKHSGQNIGAMDIVILVPLDYQDSLSVSSYLKRGNPVIVNIKNLDNDTGKRFVDFVCGSAYAYDGMMHRLGGTIFLFTPAHMGIIPADESTVQAPPQQAPEEVELLQEEEMPSFDQPLAESDTFEFYDPMPEETQPAAQYYAAAR